MAQINIKLINMDNIIKQKIRYKCTDLFSMVVIRNMQRFYSLYFDKEFGIRVEFPDLQIHS